MNGSTVSSCLQLRWRSDARDKFQPRALKVSQMCQWASNLNLILLEPDSSIHHGQLKVFLILGLLDPGAIIITFLLALDCYNSRFHSSKHMDSLVKPFHSQCFHCQHLMSDHSRTPPYPHYLVGEMTREEHSYLHGRMMQGNRWRRFRRFRWGRLWERG